tara:strand:+ start:1641 stop:2141 length:501 start_codon:yes stop_codon:yes gene_type:complete
MEEIILFPSVLNYVKTKHSEYNKAWALNYERNNKGTVISNVGGYQSIASDRFEDIPFFNVIKEGLRELPEFLFCTWWLNINRKGNYNNQHTHPKVDLSVVYYLTENYGSLILIDPLEHSRSSFNTSYSINAQPGDMFIFPADIPHRVNPHLSNDVRISLAFNIRLI